MALKTKRDDTMLTGWESMPEQAPSIVREDQPTVARFVAMVGLFFVVLGLLAMLLPRWGFRPVIGPGIGFASSSFGTFLLIYHAFADAEWQFRRLYSGLAILGIVGALILRVLPSEAGLGANFPLLGVPTLFLSLVLLIATIRHETEAGWRTMLMNILRLVGATLAAVPLTFGVLGATGTVANWLPGEGGILLVLGAFYVGAYIGLQETDSDRGYYTALGVGAVGLFAIAGALVRSLMPESVFLVPSGLILIGAGLVYLLIAVVTCVDWPVVVLARREFASYFFSPVAYLVIVGILLVAWFTFYSFAAELSDPRGFLVEPIVGQYIFGLIPVIVQMFVVPALTMRLLSEEQRTGTLEVLLTAPVNESAVVIGKFLAAWIFALILWVPWWLFLVSLRYYGREEFDYRPILSFNVALMATSAGFIAMGEFFSSLTRNQIIAGVLTFVGMTAPLAAWVVRFGAGIREGGTLYELLTYVSYLEVWWNALDGVLAPRYIVFHVSVAVFFLYLTIQVLASRKWK